VALALSHGGNKLLYFVYIYPKMNILDVDALIVVDFKGNLLIKKIFNLENDLMDKIIKKCTAEKDPIFLFENKLVLCTREQEIITILVSYGENNEIFLGNSFEQFNLALKTVLKKCNKEVFHKKYDVVFLLIDVFVYQGMISENKCDKILEQLPKRSFEATDGMKVPKGLASVLNNASKSFSRYI
jgi:hypothetical protein